MESSAEAIQRIARISAHLLPPNFQMEGSFVLKGGDCMAKRRTPGLKVTILGTTEGIGQPLAMLVKMNPLFSFLHLYDVVNAPRVTTDISRMNTSQPQLGKALKGMNLVIIPTGVPKKLGMIRDDLFNINVGIVTTLKGIAKCCPMEIVNLISNIVNSVVSIATEVFMKAGTYDPKQLMGITMLDVVRANCKKTKIK
uniref:malate dehydrogenase n=1 Tax=Manihot esculenta TaxID=3983 RepID=A0A2C9V4M8_MANES